MEKIIINETIQPKTIKTLEQKERKRTRAKALIVANRHPLNRCAREILSQVEQSVETDELYAIQLMRWRLNQSNRLLPWRRFEPWLFDWDKLNSLVVNLSDSSPLRRLRHLTVCVCASAEELQAQATPQDGAEYLLEALERGLERRCPDKVGCRSAGYYYLLHRCLANAKV